MKSLRGVSIIIAIFGAVTLLLGLSYANGENAQADIKLLRDSAVALQVSRPDLAQGLNNYADKEAKKSGVMSNESKVKEEIKEKLEPKNEQPEIINQNKEKEEVGEKVESKSEQGENTKY
ncbi:MAG: hypothetical protein NTW13_05545 [Candidatus Omnitrophica bacterium]|nr:hypothetical protein [Candidatus Omnitrophota bacterium]